MTIRRAREDELPWIRSSWVQSYADSRFAEGLTYPHVWEKKGAGAEYYEAQKRIIAALLRRSAVLVHDGGDGLLDGWVCAEPGVVHYVYVRLSSRGRGVARALVAACGLRGDVEVCYSHRGRNIWQRKLPKAWRYDVSALIGE